MTRRCPVCGSEIPDMPSRAPLTHCSARCRDRVADAVSRFLDVLTTAEPDEPTDEGVAP